MALTGVTAGDVNSRYDIALGYDDGTGTVKMVGYVIPKGGTWERGTVLDEQGASLRPVASPNAIDARDLAPWVKVSQGDWSGGERQVTYVDPTRYYVSNGNIDVTKPGALQLNPSPNSPILSITYAKSSVTVLPLVSDGIHWYLGGNFNAGAHNLIIDGTPYNVAAGFATGTHEVLDLMVGPDFVYIALVGIGGAGGSGIYRITPSGAASSFALDPQLVSLDSHQMMAYFNGFVYYVDGSSRTIRKADGFTVSAAFSSPNDELSIRGLTNTASGMLFWTGQLPDLLTNTAPLVSYAYLFDGVSASRVADIPGYIMYAREVHGVTYILASLYQGNGMWNYTLYALDGTTLSVVDDMRWLDADFKVGAVTVQSYTRGHIFGDGRFLYVGWPNFPGLKYDLVTGGVSRVGVVGGTFVHRLVNTSSGLVDVSAGPGSTQLSIVQWPGTSIANTGSLTTSYFDFGTPNLNKVFRSFEIELSEPVPSGTSVSVSYRIDNNQAWTALTVRTVSSNNLLAMLPANVIGYRVQFLVSLTASTANATPKIRAFSVYANLGRLWTVDVSCRRNQTDRTGNADPQGMRGVELLANVENCYAINAGRCVLFVPSARAGATPPSGAAYCEQVNAVLLRYTETRGGGAPPGYYADPQTSAYDMEADVRLVLAESV